MNAELLLILSGSVLSLLFSYLPGLEKWYGNLVPDVKRLIMLGMLVIVSAATYALACANLLAEFMPEVVVPCGKEGIIMMIKYFFGAMIANQATYKISPRGNGS